MFWFTGFLITHSNCSDPHHLKLCASTVNVRLVPGKNRGRVEVKYNNVWGTICDDSFGTTDGKVICKMLGFQSILSTFTATPGKKPASLSDVGAS